MLYWNYYWNSLYWFIRKCTSREFGVLGDTVNLAARLMYKQKMHKSKKSGIICDNTTINTIIGGFKPMELFEVKGKSTLIQAHKVTFNQKNPLFYSPQIHHFSGLKYWKKL